MGFNILPMKSIDVDNSPKFDKSDSNLDDIDMHDADIEDDDDNELGVGSSRLTSPGDIIASSELYMHGHGTFVHDGYIISSLAGVIERVNKLISVKPLRHRYKPQVGDLVIGRIIEVQAKRWKVDIYSSNDAVLMLSSINLPGGVQRRKLESDELQMRNFFCEGDLCVAEVQAFFNDGTISLHTRSLKYGKLRNGILVSVAPNLMRRLKSHFYTLPIGVDLILGLNGSIWVSKPMINNVDNENLENNLEGFDTEGVYSNTNDEIDSTTREAIDRTAIVINALSNFNIPITDSIICNGYDLAVDLEGDDGLNVFKNEDVIEHLVFSTLAIEQGSNN